MSPEPLHFSAAPILMAGGFMPIPYVLDAPQRYFNERGFQAMTVPYRYRDMRDVTEYAAHIAYDARAISRSAGRRINFVGFSLGGLAGLYAIKRLGMQEDTASFVAIGAPFHGAMVALFAIPSLLWSPLGFQVSPGSKFLRQLHADPLPPGPRYVSLGGELDRVCPAETAFLDGAENRLYPFRHLDFFDNLALFAELETHF